MSKVKLFIYEVDNDSLKEIDTWSLKLGSSPASSGEIREGMTVPSGKTWLFPLGGDFDSLKHIKGTKIIKSVTV